MAGIGRPRLVSGVGIMKQPGERSGVYYRDPFSFCSFPVVASGIKSSRNEAVVNEGKLFRCSSFAEFIRKE